MASEHPSHTNVDDGEGLLRLFRAMLGRRLIGAGGGTEVVELVFEPGNPPSSNLVSIFTGGPREGQVALGWIDPAIVGEAYGREADESA